MAVKLPDDSKKLTSLCERYQKQVKDLTQKCEGLTVLSKRGIKTKGAPGTEKPGFLLTNKREVTP